MKVKLRELVRWGLVVGLFVLPLIYWPRGYGVVYELPKIVFVNIWIKILVLMMVLMIIKKRLGKRLINKRLAGLVLVFLIVVLVSLFLGVDPIKSYWGNYYRRQGWWMLLHLVSLSFLVGFLIDKKNLKLMIKAISIGGGLVSLVAVIEGFYHWSNSVSAGFGNPNFLGGYLLVSLPLTIYLIKNAKDT